MSFVSPGSRNFFRPSALALAEFGEAVGVLARFVDHRTGHVGYITSKSGFGSHSYPTPGQPLPQGVTSISGATINTNFAYDAKANMNSGNGLTVSYASYNKPSSIT